MSRNCPRKGSPGHSTFRPSACSWKAAVLSLTHCHKSALICHSVAVKLWHFDESFSVSLLIPSMWHHPISVCYLLAHSLKLSKHFRGRAKPSASSDCWQEDAARNRDAHFFDIRDTIQSWPLFVGIPSKTAKLRCAEEYQAEKGFVYLLKVMLERGWNSNRNFIKSSKRTIQSFFQVKRAKSQQR